MSFGQTSPVTAWLFLCLTSRRSCRLYLWGLAILVVPSIGLRVEAALFERRAVSFVSALSGLQVGMTPRAEALSRVPILKDETALSGLPAGGPRELFSARIPNSSLSDAVLLWAARMENKPLYSALSWWAFRAWSLSAYVNFASGKVSSIRYQRMVSTGKLEVGDVVVVGVTTQPDLARPDGLRTPGESCVYRVTTTGFEPAQGVWNRFHSGCFPRIEEPCLRCEAQMLVVPLRLPNLEPLEPGPALCEASSHVR